MMKMYEIINVIPALFFGIFLGMLFFGGLWLTVKKALHSKRTALLFAGSFILRMALAIGGFYFIVQDGWAKMLICLGGFLIARQVVIRLIPKNNQQKIISMKEVRHET